MNGKNYRTIKPNIKQDKHVSIYSVNQGKYEWTNCTSKKILMDYIKTSMRGENIFKDIL